MQKIGATQGTAISGLAQLFRKNSSKLSRSASSGSKDRDTPPQVKAKPKKKSSDTTGSPDLSRIKVETSSSSPRSSFRLFKKKKGRSSREGSMEDISRGSIEDLRSETSSLNSMSRMSIREEEIESPQKEPASPQSSGGITPDVTTPIRHASGLLKSESDSIISPTNKSPNKSPTRIRGESLFKDDMPSLFDGKDSLFDGELGSLLAKTQSKFGVKMEDKEEEQKEREEEREEENEKEKKEKEKDELFVAPAKPTRKARSSKFDLSAYDRAAADAIKNVKEREQERSKEKEKAREAKEKAKKERMLLFEEDQKDEDDLFGKKKTEKKASLFDEESKSLQKKSEKPSKTKPNALFDDDLFQEEPKEKQTEEREKKPEEKKEVVQKTKSTLFDDSLVEDEEKMATSKEEKIDVVKSLFGDDNEKFASKISHSSVVGQKAISEKTEKISEPSPKPAKLDVLVSEPLADPLGAIETESEKKIEKREDVASPSKDYLFTEDKPKSDKEKSPPSSELSVSSPTRKGPPPKTSPKPLTPAKPKRSWLTPFTSTPSKSETQGDVNKETEKKKNNSEDEIPAWKKRAEERRKQRENEEKEREVEKKDTKPPEKLKTSNVDG